MLYGIFCGMWLSKISECALRIFAVVFLYIGEVSIKDLQICRGGGVQYGGVYLYNIRIYVYTDITG